MALIDMFVCDLHQRYLTEDIHNVFVYMRDGEQTALNLSESFQEDVLPKINQIQSPNIRNVDLKIYSLGDLASALNPTLSGGGSNLGVDMLPLHDAVNFTLKVASRAVRPGSKRFSGIPEAYSTSGTIDDPAYIAQLEQLRLALFAGIGPDVDVEWVPIIVKRVKYNPDPEKPDHWAYRFPEIGETPVYSVVDDCLMNLKVSHQVSRK